MFHPIPHAIQSQMKRLERMDAQDRMDNTPRPLRLRQIPPETGKFLALLAAAAPPGPMIEIGTSAGYSTLWLSLACRGNGRKITTFEILDEKAALARETFKAAQVESLIELVVGNALDYLPQYQEIAFCFLDAEKEIYAACYEMVVPRLVKGGWLVADNALSHSDELRPMLERALNDPRVDALVVPIGKGLLVCRKNNEV